MAKSSITTTRNYRLFKLSDDNRELRPKEHRPLKESMKEYGYLKSFPMVCQRNGKGELILVEGQHRLLFAEELGLPVSYIVEEKKFDIAKVNCTQKPWSLIDYAMKHSKNGLKDYDEGLEFASRYNLPPSLAFALLAGTVSFGNISAIFRKGEFKVKDKEWAMLVASTYSALINESKALKCSRFLEACMAVCRLDNFQPNRLIEGARKCRDKLVSYSTREAYLDMIEEIYNFYKKTLVPLKLPAIQVMRERNAFEKKKKNKK